MKEADRLVAMAVKTGDVGELGVEIIFKAFFIPKTASRIT
jgi:hypothetical protein